MSITDKLENANSKKPEVTEEKVETKVETKTEEKKENAKTLEQIINSTGHNDHDDEEKKTDPKDGVIVSLKKELKNNKKEMSEIKTLVSDLTTLIQNDSRAKLSEAKIQAFAEKRGVDPESIRELAELLREEPVQAPKKVDSKQTKKDEDEDEEDEDEEEEIPKVTKTFNAKRLSLAIDKMVEDFLTDIPEYAEIVDVDTVKEMILANPQAYASKTISEIVEKIYGKAIKGKGGIEAIKRQNRDTTKKTTGRLSQEEMESLKTDPVAMKEYKEDLVKRAQKFGLL